MNGPGGCIFRSQSGLIFKSGPLLGLIKDEIIIITVINNLAKSRFFHFNEHSLVFRSMGKMSG